MTDVDRRSFRLEQITDTATDQHGQDMTDVDHRFTRLEQNTDSETNEKAERVELTSRLNTDHN